jgi:zinc protease
MPMNIAFQKHTLKNGLDVILHEDHSIPMVAVNVWYHVGSQNEVPGRTGFAHLFEHVMFEGSKHHNKEYFEPLQEAGGNINGSTSTDRTNYYENVPSNYLELALWLESDRMGFLLDALDDRKFEVQRDVVKNERRQSYENRPYGMVSMEIRKALFPPNHPYHWQTIGSQEDLDAATLDDVKDFFRRFYAPNNASLAIAGDIDPEKALQLVEKYFGDLVPVAPVPRLHRWVSKLDDEVRVDLKDRVQLERVLFQSWARAAAPGCTGRWSTRSKSPVKPAPTTPRWRWPAKFGLTPPSRPVTPSKRSSRLCWPSFTASRTSFRPPKRYSGP